MTLHRIAGILPYSTGERSNAMRAAHRLSRIVARKLDKRALGSNQRVRFPSLIGVAGILERLPRLLRRCVETGAGTRSSACLSGKFRLTLACALLFGNSHAIHGTSDTIGAAAASGVSPTSCDAEWLPTRVLRTPARRPVLIDVRAATLWRGRLVVVGDPAYEWASPSAPSYAPGDAHANQLIGGVLIDARDSLSVLPIPPGVELPVQPRIGAGTDGDLHIAFGVIKDVAQRTWNTRPDSIMHSAWNGSGWTKPARIPDLNRVLWDQISTSSFVPAASGMAFALPVDSRDSVTAIVARLDQREDWHATRIATGGAAAAYVRLAAVGRSMLMAWIGAEPVPGILDRNAIFVSRSLDGGKTWEPRRRLEPPGSGMAYDPAFAVDTNGTSYIVWAKRSHAGGLPDTLASAVSVDSGRTWRTLPGHFVPHGLSTLSVAPAGRQVIAAFRDSAEARIHLRVLVNDQWIVPQHDAGPISVATPLVVPMPENRLGMLLPIVIQPSAPLSRGGRALATGASEFRISCDTR